MRRFVVVILTVPILASGLLAAPATRPAKPPTSRPTTEPARVDPATAEKFYAGILNAKFDEVASKLKATGAVAEGPTLGSATGKGKFRRVPYTAVMGYPWEYGTFTFIADDAGRVYKFEFEPIRFPIAPGTEKSAGPEYNVLRPGNKWWLVKMTVYNNAERHSILLRLTQAKSADEAEKKTVAAHLKARQSGIKGSLPDWQLKTEGVEAHEWFTPKLERHVEERVS